MPRKRVTATIGFSEGKKKLFGDAILKSQKPLNSQDEIVDLAIEKPVPKKRIMMTCFEASRKRIDNDPEREEVSESESESSDASVVEDLSEKINGTEMKEGFGGGDEMDVDPDEGGNTVEDIEKELGNDQDLQKSEESHVRKSKVSQDERIDAPPVLVPDDLSKSSDKIDVDKKEKKKAKKAIEYLEINESFLCNFIAKRMTGDLKELQKEFQKEVETDSTKVKKKEVLALVKKLARKEKTKSSNFVYRVREEYKSRLSPDVLKLDSETFGVKQEISLESIISEIKKDETMNIYIDRLEYMLKKLDDHVESLQICECEKTSLNISCQLQNSREDVDTLKSRIRSAFPDVEEKDILLTGEIKELGVPENSQSFVRSILEIKEQKELAYKVWEVCNPALLCDDFKKKVKHERKQRNQIKTQIHSLSRLLLAQKEIVQLKLGRNAEDGYLNERERKRMEVLKKRVELESEKILAAMRKEKRDKEIQEEKIIKSAKKTKKDGAAVSNRKEKSKRDLPSPVVTMKTFFKSPTRPAFTSKPEKLNFSPEKDKVVSMTAIEENNKDVYTFEQSDLSYEGLLNRFLAEMKDQSDGCVEELQVDSPNNTNSTFSCVEIVATQNENENGILLKLERCPKILLSFVEDARPAYFGTLSKAKRAASVKLTGNEGLKRFDKALIDFDYEYDSGLDWDEPEDDGDSIRSEEKSVGSNDFDYNDGWMLEDDDSNLKKDDKTLPQQTPKIRGFGSNIEGFRAIVKKDANVMDVHEVYMECLSIKDRKKLIKFQSIRQKASA